jgi:hypothetical protein
LLFGDTARKLGECCSPEPMFTSRTEYGCLTSSSMIDGFVPFGVGQVSNSIIIDAFWSRLLRDGNQAME